MGRADQTLYYKYWGKTGKKNLQDYHLLPYHCMDVAAVGWRMLSCRKRFCRRLAAQLQIRPEWFRKWFCFCLSLHDLGKFATAFQGLAGHLSDHLVPPDSTMPYTERHDSLGYRLWRDVIFNRWLQAGGFGFDAGDRTWGKCLRAFDPWFEMATGHHGVPPKTSINYKEFFTAADETAAFQFTLAMAELFLHDIDIKVISEQSRGKRFKKYSWLLSGLVVLSDWFGSAIEISAYQNKEIRVGTYWKEHALPMAETTVRKYQIPNAVVAPFSGIDDIFPFISEPTPLQKWAMEINLSNGPQLFILEDATGAGKTEAAVVLAHRLMSNGLADGIYVALPTMATANAMFERMGKAYRRMYAEGERPSLVLAHGARHLFEGFRNSVGLPVHPNMEMDYGKDDENAGTWCSAWLADSRKTALLAEVGVGTIDQALLAILPARHQCLRLLGLNRKILLIDEVHAYDPYVNQLLQTLLEAHARNGGTAILLSATLPGQIREIYTRAFCIGAEIDIPELSQDPNYPLATHIPRPHPFEFHIQTRRETNREVKVSMLHDIARVDAIVRDAVEKGKCVCWIRNTVRDARAAYDHFISQTWMKNENISLFHSRFAMMDRKRVETDALSRFGNESHAEIRRGRLLISTQVVEQSLDLDFDVLVSDLAPMDLLIQRAGRLHRHVRDAHGNLMAESGTADERGTPILHVFGPEPDDAPSGNWLKAVLPGTQAVYPHVGQIWLTQQRLVKYGMIRTPEDSRTLIEGVYGAAAQDDIPDALQSLSLDAEGDDAGKRGLARMNCLDLSRGYTWASAEKSGGWSSEINIPTRLSGDTVRVALAVVEDGILKPYAEDAEFGPWELSMLSLPKMEYNAAAEKIPRDLLEPITRLKENERILKWVEVLPLFAGIRSCYDPDKGWNPVKEETNEPD